ncbi:MAG: glycosyltransferase family 39 protein [Vicinamibacterales bacterium]
MEHGPDASRSLWRIAPLALLLALSLPDLLSPPISPTILRQTQTYAQTAHFVEHRFALAGLTMDIDGPRPFPVAYEFPVYQFVVGLLFLVGKASFFWGKLVSLGAASVFLWIFARLSAQHYGDVTSRWAACFLASSPMTLLLSAAFQPDALALALTSLALAAVLRWRDRSTHWSWLAVSLLLLAALLAKFTVVVPFVPLLAAAVLRRGGDWRRPTAFEVFAIVAIVLVPFVAWNLYRTTMMDAGSRAGEAQMFLVGDLSRFFHAGFYVKPAFIVGAMVACGSGVVLAVVGLRGLDAAGALLVAGVPLYYALIPTAAEQTYYAFPLVPAFAMLMGRGAQRLEDRWPGRRRFSRAAIVVAWLAGFAVAAPYTLRHDTVTLAAARAVHDVSGAADLLFVLNMHDRGVGIGGYNSSIVTLAGRRGWNVRFDSADADLLRLQVEDRRREGLRWIVVTWFTPDLDPWFAPLLGQTFSRSPRLNGTVVDGQGIARQLSEHYPVASRGANFAILRVE